MSIWVTAAGYIDAEGRGGLGSEPALPWPDAVPAMRWRHFSSAPNRRFGRLDLLAKLAVGVTELCGLEARHEGCESATAIVLGSEYGSLSVDLDFLGSLGSEGGASPLLFSYTLPSTALAEVAIRYGLTGPNLCLMAGAESGAVALSESFELLQSGEVSACLCLICDALSERAQDFASGHREESHGAEIPRCFAYALLLESAPEAEQRGLAEIQAAPAEGLALIDAPRLLRFLLTKSETSEASERVQLRTPNDNAALQFRRLRRPREARDHAGAD